MQKKSRAASCFPYFDGQSLRPMLHFYLGGGNSTAQTRRKPAAEPPAKTISSNPQRATQTDWMT